MYILDNKELFTSLLLSELLLKPNLIQLVLWTASLLCKSIVVLVDPLLRQTTANLQLSIIGILVGKEGEGWFGFSLLSTITITIAIAIAIAIATRAESAKWARVGSASVFFPKPSTRALSPSAACSYMVMLSSTDHHFGKVQAD